MKLNTKNEKCDTGLSVQSLIFDKKYFNASKSKDWAKSHGYKFNDIDVKDNTFRFRQDSPNKFDKDIFRTIAFRKGIKAVVACPIVNKFDNGGEADGIKPVYLEGYDFKDYEDMISSLKDAKSKKADISDYIDTPESYVKLLESYVKKMDDITEEYKYGSSRNGDGMVIKVKTYLKYNHEKVINKLVKSNNLTEEQAEILSNKFSDDNVNDDYELTNFILEQEGENASETLSDFIKLDLCKKDIGFVGSSGGYLVFQDLDFFDGVKERLEGEISDYFSSDAQFESNEYDFFEEYIQDKYGDIVEDLSNIDFLEYGFSVLEAYIKKLIKGMEKDALNGEIEYRGQEFIDESNANGWDSSVEDGEDNEGDEEEEYADEYKDGGSVNTDIANNEDSPLPIGSIIYFEHSGGYSGRLTVSNYEIVGFLGTKERDYNQKGVFKKIKLARYSVYPLKSNLKEVKGDMEEIAIPIEAEDLSLSRYRIYNKNPKGALISQSRIDSGKRRLAESEAVIEWEGIKPAYLMTKDEYNKDVTPKFREFNRFIGKNDKIFRKPNYQGIDYVDFETFKNTFVSRGNYDTAENSFNSYARRNESVEQASPELIKKLNDYLSFFTPIFGKENISKIENDESGSNKRSVKRAFEDGTYEKLLRENKINYTLLQNIYNSVGLTIPSKLEKIEKEVVELGITSDVKMQYEEKQKEFIIKLKDKFKEELQSYYEGYVRRYKNNFERLNDFYNKNGNNNFASLNEYKADYSRYNGVEPEKINERKYDRKLNEYIDVFTGKYKYHSDINVIEEYRTSNSDSRLIYDKDYYSNKNVLKLVDNWIDVLDEDAKNYANSLFEDLGKRILAEINSVNMLAKDIPDIKYGYIENLTDKGFEVWIDLEYTNGFILSIETNVIYAGGYNIQKLHTRGLFKFQNEGKFFSYDNIVEQYKKYNESMDKSKQVYYAKGIEENNQQAIKKIEKKREDSSNKRYKKSGGEHFLGFVDTHVEGRGDNYDENEEEIENNSDKLKIIESKKIALKSLISLESKSTNDLIKEKLALKIKEMEQEINDLESGKFADGGGVNLDKVYYDSYDDFVKKNIGEKKFVIGSSTQPLKGATKESIDLQFKYEVLQRFMDYNFKSNYCPDEYNKEYIEIIEKFHNELINNPKSFKDFWYKYIIKSSNYDGKYDIKSPHYTKEGKRIESNKVENYTDYIFYKYKSEISKGLKDAYSKYRLKYAGKNLDLSDKVNDLESGKFAEGGGVDYVVKKVKRLLKKEKIDSGDVSPNFVNDFAHKHGIINLTSEQVVKISDTYANGGGVSDVKIFSHEDGTIYSVDKKENGIWTIFSESDNWEKRDEFENGFESEEDAELVAKELAGLTDEFKNGGNVGNVRSLLSKFEKEKPSIALFIISDTVAESFMRKEYDKNIVWENLTDEQKAKYNTDYRVSKHEFEKYLVYEFVKLYYSDEKIKNKCKGQSTTTIKHIKSVMNDIAKGYDVNNFPKVEEVKKPDLNIELVSDSELILMMKKQETIKQAIAEIKRRNEAKKNVTETTKAEPKETVSYYRSTPVGNVPSELVEQAISQVLLTPKYQNLTKEEADFLYKAFANYESQKGKSNDYIYVIEWNYKFGSNNISAKEDDLNLKKFLQKMDKNGIIIFNYYDGTVEADKAVIDFINSVRGVINAIKNKMNVSSKEDVKDTSTTDLPEEIKEEIKMELPAIQNTDINKDFKFYYDIVIEFKNSNLQDNFINNLKQFYPNLIENGDVKIVQGEYYIRIILSDKKPISDKFKIDSPYLEELLGKQKPILSLNVYAVDDKIVEKNVPSHKKDIAYSVDVEENIANYIDSLYFISSVNKSDYSRYLLNKANYFTTEQNFNGFEQSLPESDRYDVTSTMYRVSDGSIVEVKKFVKETQVPNLYIDINNKNRIVTFSDEFGFEKVVKFKEIDKYIKEVLDSPDATDKIKLLKDFKGKLTQKVKDNVLKTMKLFAKSTVYAKYMLNYNNGDFESTYTINPSKAEIKLRNEVLKVSTQEKTTQLPIKEEVVVEQTIIPTERKGIDIPTDSKAAIKDVLTLKKYWRLTESEAEYLYNKFKNYEELVNSDGEYVAKIDFLYNGKNYEEIKDLDNQIQEFIETLEDKGYVYASIYDSEIEAYPITIDLVNSIRGRIDTRVNVSQGTDLFPATSKIEEANPNYEQIQKSKAVLRSLVYTVAKQKDAVMKKKLLDKMKEINEKIKELESQEFKKGGKVMEVLIGGKSDNLTVEDLAKKWKVRVSDIEKRITQGVKVESEHTDDKKMQMEIAKDHIFEMLDYYDRLESMEKQSRIKHTFITKKISDKQKKSIANYLKSKGISDAECDIHNNGNIFIYTELDSNVIKNISNYLKNNII
jgi:hypothetical protein